VFLSGAHVVDEDEKKILTCRSGTLGTRREDLRLRIYELKNGLSIWKGRTMRYVQEDTSGGDQHEESKGAKHDISGTVWAFPLT
jgi:hypothetical protein